MPSRLVKISGLKSVDALREHLHHLHCTLPVDDQILTAVQGSPLAAPIEVGGRMVGNRWCIHPMEGWDGTSDGNPSPLTKHRWENFGRSGAKLIWGGEAAAVQADGRANPRQLLATAAQQAGLADLLQSLRSTHRARFGSVDDLMVGLQLTHSGRFSRPNSKQLEPRIAYHHPILDRRCGIDPNDNAVVWTDDQLARLVDRYVESARVAAAIGFGFVDVKACHGYLLHETLSGFRRPGNFGGDYEGRTRLLKTIVGRIRADVPGLLIGVRLSIFDQVPFHSGPAGGEPEDYANLIPYEFAFGVDPMDPQRYDLTEPIRLMRELRGLGVAAVNVTCGSPYYTPHIQRPAMFPPSDGYGPPEDPLIGVDRLVEAARQCKAAVPDLPMVGTGYTYLQDYLVHVAQAVVRASAIDFVGVGRMVLAYPDLPADSLDKGVLERKRICRTFSDCTTAPRNGLVSGCYPLDPYYKQMPEAVQLKTAKKRP